MGIDKNIPGNLYGDDQRLAQVITNLLSNAVKFTPEEGSIRLDTALEGEEDGFCVLRISVTDSGIGISPEQQVRLFSSFQQADSSTSRKFGGTGLGLAISKRIIEMMNGRIWIVSALGQGSSFLERGKNPGGNLLGPGMNWGNLRIMAVDDAKDIRDYFQDLSEQLKFSCDTAADGGEALEKIKATGAYDIYFVDWKMPGMNGIELTKKIKEDLPARSVVIMISAQEWTVIEDEAKKAGVNKFMSKPLFPSTIADCISECIGSANQAAAAGKTAEEEAVPLGDYSGFRLLLAEDVEINREILQTLLEPTNLEITSAENGAEALRLFTAEPDKYHLIFMDVQMPEMDGYEATRKIRAWEKEWSQAGEPRKPVPIVAMTANVFREDIEKCLEAGMNAHLGKPLDLEEVLAKLSQYLAR